MSINLYVKLCAGFTLPTPQHPLINSSQIGSTSEKVAIASSQLQLQYSASLWKVINVKIIAFHKSTVSCLVRYLTYNYKHLIFLNM